VVTTLTGMLRLCLDAAQQCTTVLVPEPASEVDALTIDAA
jgi:hypothetical protein